jgi:cephalosporin hydroxylase
VILKKKSPRALPRLWKYLETHNEFEIDRMVQNKLLVTVAPDGYLKRIA